MLGPDSVAAGGKDSIGIDSVLHSLVKSQKGVVVKRIGRHHRALMRRRGAVLVASERASMENMRSLGMPNSGTLTLSICAGVSGSLYASPSINSAPGIAENFSLANSQLAALAAAAP